MYRNTADLCGLVLCTVTVLNSLLRSSSFLFFQISWNCLHKRATCLEKKDNFPFSPIWLHLISFSCLSGLARISRTILKVNGESRSCCLILELLGETFSLSQLSICIYHVTHSSTLAWKIPWVEEPDRLQSMGSLRVRHDWATSLSLFTFMHWRRKWQPTPVFSPGESQGRGSLAGCRLWGCTESDTTEAT